MVVIGARTRRWLLVASPFLLLALGFYALVASPWPTILGLMERGQRVVIVYRWSTVGQLILSLACFVAALAVSFNIRRR